MTLIQDVEFKNQNDDKVDVRLCKFGEEFQVIINSELTRRTTEKRFNDEKIVELSVMIWTHDVQIIKTTVERTALLEYNLHRALQGEPGYTVRDFQEWQKATEQEES